MIENEMMDSKEIHEFCEEGCDCKEGIVTQEFLDENCVFVDGEWRMKDDNT